MCACVRACVCVCVCAPTNLSLDRRCIAAISGMRQVVDGGGGGSLEGQLTPAYFNFWTSRAVLCPHRKTAAAVNDAMARRFPRMRVVEACDTIDDAGDDGCDVGSGFSPDKLAGRTPSGLAPHTLQLAVGMPIMAIANMPQLDVYNGTRLIVTSIVSSRVTGAVAFLGCGFYDRDGRLRVVDIHRVSTPANDGALSFQWTRRQFPVMPCFGMTIRCVAHGLCPCDGCRGVAGPFATCRIAVVAMCAADPLPCPSLPCSKSQGQTLTSRVGVLLTSNVWTHGLLYVALGRVVHPDNIRVLCQGDGSAVMNVVYTDVMVSGESDPLARY
eukprot:SAG11_NODE_324_length_10739_cov_86.975752_3_plen_327_part_00